MQEVLLNIQKDIKKTIVFITHNLDEALKLGDQIAVLRDGAVIQQGSSQDIVLRSADDYIASFVKEVNRGRIIQVEAVMTPHKSGEPVPSCVVPTGTTLNAAARLLTRQGVSQIGVVDELGKPLGSVTIEEIMAAMVDSGMRIMDDRGVVSSFRSKIFTSN